MITIATIGHSNRPVAVFVDLLLRHDVGRLIDVRRFPSSRNNPQFNRDALAASLKSVGIAYEHVPALGGRRETSRHETRNGAWAEPAFRNYADFALTPSFQSALGALIGRAERDPCAIMCAERDWRHCHRQIIADYLIARGFAMLHLIEEDRVEAGRLSPTASLQSDGTILYPPRQGELILA